MSAEFIAEFCQNHNGDFEILQKMVWDAAEVGAKYAKIQTMYADDLSHRKRFDEGEINEDGTIKVIKRPYIDEYNRMKSLEVSYKNQEKFIRECEKANIIPMTSLCIAYNPKHDD